MAGKDLEKLQEELKWVQIREEHSNTFFEKMKSKGITGILVPADRAQPIGEVFGNANAKSKVKIPTKVKANLNLVSDWPILRGCLITVGILCRGLYFMKKRDNKAQQLMMRYRVGAQGITIALALISIFAAPLAKNK